LIEEKINAERETIDAARRTIAQLDEQVNQTISRTVNATNDSAVGRSVTIRRNQARERADLRKTIEESQGTIAILNEQKIPIAAELRKVEAEVGPIKYIAQLIYGEQAATDTSLLEKAVQWVTILIVIVFDPLAVVLLIAANWSLKNRAAQTNRIQPTTAEQSSEIQHPVYVDSVPESEPAELTAQIKVDKKPKRSKVVDVDEEWHSRPRNHLSPQKPDR